MLDYWVIWLMIIKCAYIYLSLRHFSKDFYMWFGIKITLSSLSFRSLSIHWENSVSLAHISGSICVSTWPFCFSFIFNLSNICWCFPECYFRLWRIFLEHSLTSHTKINSKWIKDLNVRPDAKKTLSGKHRQNMLWNKLLHYFFGSTS